MGRIIVITGGSSGLGREIAAAMASEKDKVIICARDEQGLKAVCNAISRNGGKCDYSVVDVTSKKQVDEFVDLIMKKDKRIDVLVNNAGYASTLQDLESTREDELGKNFETNVYSVFYFIKKVIPVMRKQKEGMIINVSSMAGKRGVPSLSVYSASKFAVIGLTQAVAKELENTGVKCVALCPGGINTPMRAKIFGREDAEKQQDAKSVAVIVRDIASNKINVPSGGDVVVRHGKIDSINPSPVK